MVMAAGTSVAACLPAFIAASITGTCHSHGVAVNTRSSVLGLAEPLEIPRTARIDGRRGVPRGDDGFLRPRRSLLANVTDGGDATAGNLQEVFNVTPTLQADADHPNSNKRYWCLSA